MRLTTLGDSFVEGRGDPGPDGTWDGWVNHLAGMLALGRGSVRNLGTYRATTQDVVDRQLPAAMVGKSPLCGVVAGVNDLVSDYDPDRLRRNLATVLGRLSGMDTVVFTATFADIPGNLPVPPAFRALLRERFRAANDTVREVAAATGAICLDVTGDTRWSEGDMWCPDGLHPSPLGHRYFAGRVADLLERVAGVPLAVAPTISI